MKFEEKVYFKLCSFKDNKPASCFTEGRFRLQYSLNRTTRPIPGSLGIFVFDHLTNLKHFHANYCVSPWSWDWIIFQCLVKGPVIRTEKLACDNLDINQCIYPDYRRMNRARRLNIISNWHGPRVTEAPLGTFSVASVKPIYLVDKSKGSTTEGL